MVCNAVTLDVSTSSRQLWNHMAFNGPHQDSVRDHGCCTRFEQANRKNLQNDNMQIALLCGIILLALEIDRRLRLIKTIWQLPIKVWIHRASSPIPWRFILHCLFKTSMRKLQTSSNFIQNQPRLDTCSTPWKSQIVPRHSSGEWNRWSRDIANIESRCTGNSAQVVEAPTQLFLWWDVGCTGAKQSHVLHPCWRL